MGASLRLIMGVKSKELQLQTSSNCAVNCTGYDEWYPLRFVGASDICNITRLMPWPYPCHKTLNVTITLVIIKSIVPARYHSVTKIPGNQAMTQRFGICQSQVKGSVLKSESIPTLRYQDIPSIKHKNTYSIVLNAKSYPSKDFNHNVTMPK